MEDPTPLFTSDNPSYEMEVRASMSRHPAGQKLKPAPKLEAPKPVRNLKRVK